MTPYDRMMTRRKAQEYQRHSQWELAALEWEKMGEQLQADACRMIKESGDRGDRFRARVRELTDAGTPYQKALEQADREVYER